MGTWVDRPDLVEEIRKLQTRISAMERDSRPSVSLLDTSSPAIPTGSSSTELSWTADDALSNRYAMWNVASPLNVTIPKPGLYAISLSVIWQASAAGSREAGFYHVGGTPPIAGQAAQGARATETGTMYQTASASHRHEAGDALRAYVWQTSGGNLNLLAALFVVAYVGN